MPAARAGIASGVSYVTLLVGAELGLAVTAAVVQNRLAANLGTAAGSGAEDGAALASAFISGEPSPQAAGALDIGTAFAGAISAALLVCSAVAVLAAIVGVRFAPRPVRPVAGLGVASAESEHRPDRGIQHRIGKER